MLHHGITSSVRVTPAQSPRSPLWRTAVSPLAARSFYTEEGMYVFFPSVTTSPVLHKMLVKCDVQMSNLPEKKLMWELLKDSRQQLKLSVCVWRIYIFTWTKCAHKTRYSPLILYYDIMTLFLQNELQQLELSVYKYVYFYLNDFKNRKENQSFNSVTRSHKCTV